MATKSKKKNGCNSCCCKSPQEQERVKVTNSLKTEVKNLDIPYGSINFYSGVRMSNNTYTCPMLAIHLYHYEQFEGDRRLNNDRVLIDRKQEEHTYQTHQQLNEEARFNAAEDVIMIPLEDILLITYTLGVSKRIEAETRENIVDHSHLNNNGCCSKNKIEVKPYVHETISYAPSNRIVDHAARDIPIPESPSCCSCCRSRRKKKLFKRIKQTKTTDRHVERTITMIIEYSKYSNLDSATNTRLLSNEDQLAYYRTQFNPKSELKFYLLKETQIDPKNFDLTKTYAEILCRTVMQLKGMKNSYPSDYELQIILTQNRLGTFGNAYNEPSLQVSTGVILPGTTDPQYQQLYILPQNQQQYYLPKTPQPYHAAPILQPYLPATVIRPVYQQPSPYIHQQ
ncbi:hypothetical protein I4U23_015641 [Adineta vaga]|nr:hypothetical protein I4U23_015641 [Adineta vaga]